MSIKPIIFNDDMVQAILEGRKTVTRRVVRPQLPDHCQNCMVIHKEFIYDDNTEDVYCARCGNPLRNNGFSYKPPYHPGDILYVRETYVTWHLPLGDILYCYKATDPNGNKRPTSPEFDCDLDVRPWRPSIYMPKAAARIFLRVTDVRLEPLMDITDDGALHEGAKGVRCDHYDLGEHGCTDCMNTGWIEPPTVEFMYIWDSTIKKSDLDSYGWDANPWVWVIEFERCDKPGGWCGND